jgi:hypothetical protein
MCGYPFTQRGAAGAFLAAPVPSPAAYDGRPVYWTNLVVARRYGSEVPSASALRDHRRFAVGLAGTTIAAAAHAAPRRAAFSASVGPLVTPLCVALTVTEGRADMGLDSYCTSPSAGASALAAKLRVIARTGTPIHRSSGVGIECVVTAHIRCAPCRFAHTTSHPRVNPAAFGIRSCCAGGLRRACAQMRAAPMLAIPVA